MTEVLTSSSMARDLKDAVNPKKGRNTAEGLCIAWKSAFRNVSGMGWTLTVVDISPLLHCSYAQGLLSTFTAHFALARLTGR